MIVRTFPRWQPSTAYEHAYICSDPGSLEKKQASEDTISCRHGDLVYACRAKGGYRIVWLL